MALPDEGSAGTDERIAGAAVEAAPAASIPTQSRSALTFSAADDRRDVDDRRDLTDRGDADGRRDLTDRADPDDRADRHHSAEPVVLAAESGTRADADATALLTEPVLVGVNAAGVDAPAGTAAAASAGPDDFRRIPGVGPKAASALQAAGIRSFEQLAQCDEATLRNAMRSAGVRAAATLPTWAQHAAGLAGAPAAVPVRGAGRGRQRSQA